MLVALKSEGRIELWAEAASGWTFIRSYLVQGTSGQLGPKLREGEHQVPEGLYRVRSLNPQSRYHLALALDYPNALDAARGLQDGRAQLGSDIMIHGGSVSDGCLPVGDEAIEELFALVTRIGVERVGVIISPLDLRRAGAADALARARVRPAWLPELYAEIARALAAFPLPAQHAGAAAGARVRHAGAPRCAPYDAADCVRRCQRGDMASCARAGVLYRGGRGVPASAASALASTCEGGRPSTAISWRRSTPRATRRPRLALPGHPAAAATLPAVSCSARCTGAATPHAHARRLRSRIRARSRGWARASAPLPPRSCPCAARSPPPGRGRCGPP